MSTKDYLGPDFNGRVQAVADRFSTEPTPDLTCDLEPAALKPCPFCGPGQSHVDLWHDDVSKRWRVGCGRCGCSTGISPRDKTQAPAIEAWNRRALSEPAAPAGAEPIAWMFELANARNIETGEPCNWGKPQLSFTSPSAGKYQRNITPLYATPQPVEPPDDSLNDIAAEMLVALKRCEEMVSTTNGPPDWDRVREVIAKATGKETNK